MRTTNRDFVGWTVLVIFFGGLGVFSILYLYHEVFKPIGFIAGHTSEISRTVSNADRDFRHAEFMRTIERIEKNLENIKYLLVMGMDEYRYDAEKIRRMMDLKKEKLNLMK